METIPLILSMLFVLSLALIGYFSFFEKTFQYRLKEELNNEYRLITVSIDGKLKNYIIQKNIGTWEDFKRINTTDEFFAKKEFLKETKQFVKPVIKVVK